MRCYEFYRENLAPLEERELLTMSRIPTDCQSNYHIFFVLLEDLETRDGLMAHLKQNGISAVFHYIPLHSSEMGKKFGYEAEDFRSPKTSARGFFVCLCFRTSRRDEQMRVVNCIADYLGRQRHSV